MFALDRRKHRRFALKLASELFIGPARAPHGAELADLSEGGAFLTVRFLDHRSLQLDDAAHLGFEVCGFRCEGAGRIVRILPFGPESLGVAIELTEINPVLRNYLRNLEAASDALKPDYLANIRAFEVHIS